MLYGYIKKLDLIRCPTIRPSQNTNILAQYSSVPKIPGYVSLPGYLILGKCRILYTHISTYFNNKILYIPKVKLSKCRYTWNPWLGLPYHGSIFIYDLWYIGLILISYITAWTVQKSKARCKMHCTSNYRNLIKSYIQLLTFWNHQSPGFVFLLRHYTVFHFNSTWIRGMKAIPYCLSIMS
jgi:hypothetical protein